ncbi:ATP-NAD kinase-like domain containing protein [Rhypophila sp. PSN 637]
MAHARTVSFEDTHSSGSDDENSAVEVSFDPTSPYRRKSSMVSSAGIPSRFRHSNRQNATRKTECLVHQLLESQKQRPPVSRTNTQDTIVVPEQEDGTADNANGYRVVQADDDSDDKGLNTVLDPKGKEDRIEVCEAVKKGTPISMPGETDDEKTTTKTIVTDPPPQRLSEISETDSRLLTKKQLIEMAWGVRELSRRLGSVRLRFKVKSIFLLTKPHDNDLIPKARALARWLLSKDRDVQYTVYVDRKLKDDRHFDVQGLIHEVAREFATTSEDETNVDDGNMSMHYAITATKQRLRFWDEEMCRARPQTFDFVLSLGGDGTVLYASWLFQRIVPPVLSFALGSLGFLTKFDFEKYESTLTSAFNEGVTVSLRLRFEATVMRTRRLKKRKILPDGNGDSGLRFDGVDGEEDVDVHIEDEEDEEAQRKRDLVEELIGEEKDDEHTHRPDGTYEVLNEVVVDRGPNPTMSFTEIFGDDEHFTSILADGVCVSTPTGSTAYNLAAGGSLCHPENPVMLVTAICAHTLSFRPIILPDTIVLRIGVPYDARTSSWASFDGRERIELKQGDYVTISASRYPFAAVQVPGRRGEDWINSISAKLGWNTRQRQKPFKEEDGDHGARESKEH